MSLKFPGETKYAFEPRNGVVIKQYSSGYTIAYDEMLNGMVERRMRQSIFAIASFWYTAWVNAGQPDLSELANSKFSESELKEFDDLNDTWKTGNNKIKAREHDD